MTEPRRPCGADIQPETTARRDLLRKAGRFVAVSAPAVTLLLASGMKPAKAVGTSQVSSSRQFKIAEGAVDTAAVLAAVTGGVNAAVIDPLDGVGLCLAAIKALSERIGGLELQAAAF
jgi:hypothetical protein